MEEHSTVVWARPTDNTALTMYVKGETRYMKIQNPGRAVGVTRTLFSNLLAFRYSVNWKERNVPAKYET